LRKKSLADINLLINTPYAIVCIGFDIKRREINILILDLSKISSSRK
jgi:hypothetical protein